VAARRRDVVASQIEEATPGLYLEFSVTDNGMGMDADTRARIFDPFFTTKGVSDGTGLGLAVVYGAAHAHQGWVEVDSQPGEGSTFRVLIPAAESAIEQPKPEGSGESAQGMETILLADDEPKLRRLIARTLRQHGYRIIEAENGSDAVSQFEQNSDDIELAILDVTMPVLDGVAALERMRTIRPGLPAVLMSGLLDIDEAVLASAHTIFLSKPYDLDQVSEDVRKLLDEST
jgi:CheY-like chemotaxis protein